MAQEVTTIARPYAEAIFSRALETTSLDAWADKLAFLDAVLSDTSIRQLIDNPETDKHRKSEMLIAVAGEQLDSEGQNLIRLLVENGRLNLMSAIVERFEKLKRQQKGVLDVTVTSAFAMNDAQQQSLAQSLKGKLGCEVNIISEQDPELIGGIHIRAGDLVIDGSVKGQLSQLAHELGI
jgi:F-type H+-transporting ATPase subunit delta